MAEGVIVEGKTVEELEREITCGICQEHYTDPKILPCLHYYCKQCVLALATKTSTAKPFSCPECRGETTLPEGGVDELKTAFFVNRLKTTISTMEQAQGKVEVKCELCDDSTGSAEAFCRQCARFICKECVNLHKRLAIFKSHEVASLDDLKHGRAKPIEVKEPPTKKCPIHEKSLKLYCYDCDSLICQHCTLKDHRDHNFEFNKKAGPDEKKKLLEEINPLKDIQAKLTNALEQVKNTKLKIEKQEVSSVNIIKTSFKELRDILDEREQELVEEIRLSTQEKASKLSVQEKTLSLACAEVQSVVDYTERCVRHCTNSEVMSMLVEMLKTIQKKTEEHSKSVRSLEPVEMADMRVEIRCAETLRQLCQTQANVFNLSDPTKYIVHLDDPQVGKISRGTLVTRFSKNEEAKRDPEVTSQIKSLRTGVVTDCDIGDDGPGIYSILYKPTVRGRHELTVLIDGQHVEGSPFPVFVSIHPTQLGKPVKVWSGLSSPIGITANSKGEVLVTEKKGNVIKFCANGRRDNIVAEKKLTALRCIAVDNEDNIYCIDECNNKILTCDKDGGSIQIREVKTNKGPGRRALSIIKNELLISEAKYWGVIMVYNRELICVRRIQHKDIKEVVDISNDDHGSLYVTDTTNSCVRIFSSEGVLLHSFGHDSNHLKNPWGICVSGQYVHVTDTAKHCVSVFTTDGVFVTSFGQKGSKEGDFNFPCYLYGDKDGFIYVCDYLNNRIQCF